MSPFQLTDVQATNLYLLQVIRLGIERDPVLTSCKFALDAAQAEHLRRLTQEELCSLVARVGENTLFPPRQDLLRLLTAPAPLAASLAAVHPPQPSPVPSRT